MKCMKNLVGNVKPFSFLQENSVTFEKWKTSVWKEGIFGFHQVSPEVATDSVFTTIGHPRFTITTCVCTGDQVQLSLMRELF